MITAEEFVRNKVKEKNPNIGEITLSKELITAEEGMLWMQEFKQLHLQDGWFLVEIIKPMSTTFKQGMTAWCKYTSNRKDFKLKTLTNNYEQEFGFAYIPHFKVVSDYRLEIK